MQFNLVAVVLIGLAAMFFGYFFGLFEGRDLHDREGVECCVCRDSRKLLDPCGTDREW